MNEQPIKRYHVHVALTGPIATFLGVFVTVTTDAISEEAAEQYVRRLLERGTRHFDVQEIEETDHEE